VEENYIHNQGDLCNIVRKDWVRYKQRSMNLRTSTEHYDHSQSRTWSTTSHHDLVAHEGCGCTDYSDRFPQLYYVAICFW